MCLDAVFVLDFILIVLVEIFYFIFFSYGFFFISRTAMYRGQFLKKSDLQDF